MKITKIEKKKHLYLMHLDDNRQYYLTEDSLVHFLLSKDKELTPKELDDLLIYNTLARGKQLALYYLSFQDRTEKEIREYLIKHELDANYLDCILNQLKEMGWVNDLAYAKKYIRSQMAQKKGSKAITQKLMIKGVDQSLILEALSDYDFSDTCQELAEKLLDRYQGKLNQQALKNKLLQTITNRGFSLDQAKKAIQNLTFEDDKEQEIALLEQDLDKLYRKYSRRYEGYELKQHLFQALLRKGYRSDEISSRIKEYF